MSTTHTAPASPTAPRTSPRSSSPKAPGLAQSIWLVSEREVTMRLRSKAFLVSTGILLLLILAGIIAGGFMSKNTTDTKVAVIGSTAASLQDVPGFDLVTADDRDAAEQLVRDGDVEAAIVPASGDQDGNPSGLEVIGDTEVSPSLVQKLSVPPVVTLLQPGKSQDSLVGYLVSIGFGLVFLMSAMTFGQTIAQSVVEEKQTRVVEILMSAIPVRALLAGKVLGNSILAFGQIAAMSALSVIGLTVTGQNELLAGLGMPIVWFVVFFMVGFVLLASLFAAAAAMVSRQEDIGSTTMPVMMLVMLPYFLIIFFNDNAQVVTIMSYVPFSAAVGMPVRLFLGAAQWWEPLVSLLILAATAAVMIAFGSRIYANSLLKMGGRVKLGEALKG